MRHCEDGTPWHRRSDSVIYHEQREDVVVFDLAIHNWNDVAAIVTITGVPIALVGLAFAYRQFKLQASLHVAAFEDGFVREYRALIQQIPTKALLGDTLTPLEREQSLKIFYHYVDLCNEQAYQAKEGRIRAATWNEWKSGIEGNLRRPEFARAWAYIASKSANEFTELRAVAAPALSDINCSDLVDEGGAQATLV